MMQQLKKLQAKIDARAERERAILFVVVAALLVMLALNLVIYPKLKQIRQAQQKHDTNLVMMQTNQQELELVNAGRVADVDAEVKHQIAENRKRLDALREQASKFEQNLVAPEKMNELLEQVLERNKNLKVIALKSYPVENILKVNLPQDVAGTASVAATSSPALSANELEVGLFRHEVELVFEGNYLDMLSYLKSLEALPQRLYWNKMHLRVVEYPQSRLSLRVFTVSQEKKWLDL